jgi:hypothetical protein
MKLDRRTRIAGILVLALLAGLPGVLLAACGPCSRPSAMPCCHPGDGTLTVQARSCCETVKSSTPSAASPAIRPASSAPAIALAEPLALAAEPLTAPPLPVPPPGPPLLHEGVGLYTLHSVFLI